MIYIKAESETLFNSKLLNKKIQSYLNLKTNIIKQLL